MIEPTAASPAATGAGGAAFAAAGARAPARVTTRSFAGELARFAAASSTSPSTSTATATSTATQPPQRPDGEQTRKVAGHPFARIENGVDRGRYLNQLAGSPRQGQVFRLVERDDRVFHVYGSGANKLVVELKRGRAA